MKTFIVVILALICASAVFGQAPADVPKDHWAYDSVEYLVSKGYIKGYPGGHFLGERTLTRYEFATIIKRIIDELKEKAESGQADTITTEDVDKISKLRDEFKVELVVIGERLDKVETAVAALGQQMKSVQAELTDQKTGLDTTKVDVSKLKKVTFSGYVQARYTMPQANFNSPASDAYSDFRIRRARLKATAKPTDESMAVMQIDLGGNASTAVNSQGKSVDVTQVNVKEAYVGYAPKRGFAKSSLFKMGQMNWPFGYELPLSSALLETGERALITQRFFPGEYDRGFEIAGTTHSKGFNWALGTFNGAGANNPDKNDAKDIVTNLKYNIDNFTVGAAGYFGKGFTTSTGTFLASPKDRYGANFQYYLGKIALKGEYMRGRGVEGQAYPSFNPAQWVNGWYALMDYSFLKDTTFVSKYETISEDPLYPQYERRNSWSLGLIHNLDTKTRLKFFYQINDEEANEFSNNEARMEWLTVF